MDTINILLILNPNSGSINVSLITTKVRKQTSTLNYHLDIYETTGEKDAQNIKNYLNQNNYKRVIAAGGDGTINLVGALLKNTGVILGILSCGSANGLATALNIPQDIDDQILLALQGTSTHIDIIKINDNHIIHIADLGINAELIYNFDQTRIRGKFGYFLNTIPTIYKANYPYTFNLHFNNKKLKMKGILLAFANATKFGTGAVINPQGSINDGKFEVIIFKKLSFWHILKTFFKKNTLENSFAESFSVKKAEITCPKPVALQIDGEFIGKVNNVVAKIIPGALKIALPQQ